MWYRVIIFAAALISPRNISTLFAEIRYSQQDLHISVIKYVLGRFTSPGQEFAEQDKTLMKYYQANQIPERVVLVNTVPEAFKLVDEEDRVYVVNLLTARRIPNICDYEIISDKTFPTIPFGFFFSNASPAWFKPDGPLMQKTGDVFQHDMKRYVNR